MEFDDSDNDSGHEGQLECDLSAYILFHEGHAGEPCLTFDIIRDSLGEKRNCDSPVICTFLCGSQVTQTHLNTITLLKMSNLHKVKVEEDEDDEDESELPVLRSVSAHHNGCVNRIRVFSYGEDTLAASWSELGQVNIWKINPMIESLQGEDSSSSSLENFKPLYTFNGHNTEGFALDWAPTMEGTLATGDCSKFIHVWKPNEGGSWSIGSPYVGHKSSVEDIQWSPNEEHVFASCSVDRSIRIWDERASPDKACMLTCNDAHSKDVNVIHWNRNDPFIASGGDDSKVLIWDLRKFESGSPVALLKHHKAPVCTVEWHPTDSSVLASGGEDDCIFQWDLAVEKDNSASVEDKEHEEIPPQLLFVHQGQNQIKEIHWHPQIPGLMISTAHSGFNIFKTISI